MRTGRCLCGSVKFAISGEPLAMYHCHCGQCRRASGSSFATNALVRSEDFELLEGSAEPAALESSPGKRRHFCGRCGSPIWSRSDALPQLVSVRCGTLDGDPGLRPAAHIHVASKAPWFEICDDLEQKPEGLTGPNADKKEGAERFTGLGAEAARRFAEQWLPAWTGNDPERLASFYTDDVFYCDPAIPNGVRGRTALLAYFTRLLAQNPRWVWRHVGSVPIEDGFLNQWHATIPAGPKVVEATGVCTAQLRGGRIYSNQVFFDRSELLEAWREIRKGT
jgi:hypothetical protein